MRKNSVRQMTQLAMLSAILFVMAQTPLGYFRTPILSVSFLTVPVAIGAILLGPVAGAVLGTIFGLTSFAGAFAGQGLTAMMLNINPVACFVCTVGARFLCGLCCGLIFSGLDRVFHGKKLAYVLAAVSCPACNTLFFMGSLMLLYGHTAYIQNLCAQYHVANPAALAIALVGVQGLVELVCCGAMATAICIPVSRYTGKKK